MALSQGKAPLQVLQRHHSPVPASGAASSSHPTPCLRQQQVVITSFSSKAEKPRGCARGPTARSFPPSFIPPPPLTRHTRRICSARREKRKELSLLLCRNLQQARLNAFRTTSLLLNAKCFILFLSPPSVLLRHCPLQGWSRALLVFRDVPGTRF